MDLEDLYKKTPFDTIVLTTVNISDETIDLIRDFARVHNVRVTMFLSQEYPADKDFFNMLQSKAINPIKKEEPEDQDDPGLGL